MTKLDGRVALVTGAARGIGAEIARTYARAGAKVGVLDLEEALTEDTVSAIEDAGGQALGLGADVSDAGQVRGAVERLVQEFGGLDIAVNNAGVTRDNLLFKMTQDDWDTVMNVHLRGMFLVTAEAQRHMVQQRYGRVINISSTSALGNRGQANYSAAKAGVQGFTRTTAIELGPFGVTVNSIGPGFVDTEMTRATAERLGVPADRRLSEVAAGLPVRRVGQPADIANAALFLAAEESGFVTGQVLYVDGGRSVR
ncbi:3-oxoacyl-ACP reductase FabG [Actinomadura sp. 7K534]|uniref:SDR family NAD(P)-dependent oxidoreductase n=1 Tax=Actinomadura sp. 7K534 TaxID=2530366 RepID=UPI0010471C50|nr:3-oxoacyl-ACP reductase FabG [Actinomadura sp. 7K534]TDB86416.1 glucose 1-dehydrogenase [Actinomadura sp. 7K534]